MTAPSGLERAAAAVLAAVLAAALVRADDTRTRVVLVAILLALPTLRRWIRE